MSLSNLKITYKLLLLVGLMSAVTAGIGAMSIINLQRLETNGNEIELAGREALTGARLNQNILILSRSEFRIAANPTEAELKEVQGIVTAQRTLLDERFKTLKATADAEQAVLLAAIDRAYGAYLPELEDTFATARQRGAEVQQSEAQAAIRASAMTSRAAAETLFEAVRAYSTYTEEKARRISQTASASTEHIKLLMLVAIAVGVGLGLGGGYLLATYGIVRPLARAVDGLRGLAAGRLDIAIFGLGRKDEIGVIAATLQVFKDNAIAKQRMDEAEQLRLSAERQASDDLRRREAAIGQEIAALIDSVSQGDLAQRIDLAGKDGFYRVMSEGVNRLTQTIAVVIADLSEVLSALAQGDLNQRIDKDFRGAFATVKTNVNATADKLAEVVGQLESATDAIANAAAEVSGGNTDLSERTEQQASNLEETAAALEQLGATVRTSAENAQRANVMVVEARKDAESGGAVADAAVESIKQIEESSRKISEIIGVIDEIAFQTNLLALNAAVEAARAGDAGRGFAVVAQEVRVLAQRSAQASREIKALILSSGAQVQNGVAMVTKAGAALTGIVQGVQHVAGLIGEIAGASREQTTALDEINAAVAQMDETTQKNAGLVEETTAAARAMSEQADNLRLLMGFFTLDRPAGELRAASPGRPARVPRTDQTSPAPTPVGPVKGARKQTRMPVRPKPADGALRHAGDPTEAAWKEF